MATLFDYDWFYGSAFKSQIEQARSRCARKKYPEEAGDNPDYQKFVSELEVRTLIYFRDGFSYEMKELVDLDIRSMLTFECEPVDEQYKVGSFIISTLFEEVVRVEIFAVHPAEKPEDMPLITGFRNTPSEPLPVRDEGRDKREVSGEIGDTIET